MKNDDQKNVTGNGKITANGGNADIADKDVSGSLILKVRKNISKKWKNM